VSRLVAWFLAGSAVVLAPVGLVLGVIGERRGLDLPPDRGSELFVEAFACVGALLFAAVGLLIARKQARNTIGWIFLGSALTLAWTGASLGYADLAVYGDESWPAAEWAAWVGSWLVIVPAFVSPCFVAQLFPDGRPLPGRWRWVLRFSVILAAYLAVAPALQPNTLGSYPTVDNPAALPGGAGTVIVDPTWGVSIFALFILSLLSVVVRFRRSSGIERQQLRWLAVAGAFVIVAFAVTLVVESVVGGIWATASGVAAFSCFVLMPVAVAVAILRYRLYEIDRVVSKTLVYAALTVVLGAAYLGLVLAGQALFSSFAGGSNLTIAISTLVVAALFLPLRSRVQHFVDLRFYRRRYDAQRTLEEFGARLRNQMDIDGLREELEVAVRQTMRPAHVSSWVRVRR
jgi:hypothetical protein